MTELLNEIAADVMTEIGVEWDDGQGFALAAVKFFDDFGHAPAQIDQEIVELMFRRTREYLESKAEPVPA